MCPLLWKRFPTKHTPRAWRLHLWYIPDAFCVFLTMTSHQRRNEMRVSLPGSRLRSPLCQQEPTTSALPWTLNCAAIGRDGHALSMLHSWSPSKYLLSPPPRFARRICLHAKCAVNVKLFRNNVHVNRLTRSRGATVIRRNAFKSCKLQVGSYLCRGVHALGWVLLCFLSPPEAAKARFFLLQLIQSLFKKHLDWFIQVGLVGYWGNPLRLCKITLCYWPTCTSFPIDLLFVDGKKNTTFSKNKEEDHKV